MKILHLKLKKKWFDMIFIERAKKEEYREIKPYFAKRLIGREYDAISFTNGYSKTAPAGLIEFNGVTEGIGNADWGAPSYPVYIIKLGEIISTENISDAD